MADDESDESPRIAPPAEVAARLGVGRVARHVLLCGGPSCCDSAAGARTWGTIKRELARHGLGGYEQPGPAVLRTKCDCLRICARGPIVVVYPEGVWYEHVDEAAARRIIEEHVLGGRIVEELAFAVDPLAGGCIRRCGDEG